MTTLAVLEQWFLWLMIYSFIGWAYESTLCSVSARKLINRGFLNGPYCPIYGTGALLIELTLGRIESPVLLFFAGALLTCSLEYLTSWAMEKLFHARWWDYSKRRFNIKGRVCLIGAVVFGTFSVLLVKLLHPFVAGLTGRIPPAAMHWLCGGLLVVFLTDLTVTVCGLSGTHKAVAECSEFLRERRAELEEKLRSAPGYEELQRRREAFQQLGKELRGRLNAQQRRTIRNFPKLTLSRNNEALNELRAALEKARDSRREARKQGGARQKADVQSPRTEDAGRQQR